MAPVAMKKPRLFAAFKGPDDLLGVTQFDDPLLEAASPASIRVAHGFAAQSILALRTSLEARNISAKPPKGSSPVLPGSTKAELVRSLIHANLEVLGLGLAITRASASRQYLSTALFAAEVVESFQTLTHRSDPGKTDGEAVSRVVAFKLAPEISLVPGFNTGVTQQWWKDGHHDFANTNSENDQSPDGNASGVMFLLFLTDYLGIPLDQIIQHMPPSDGAPLGQTYVSLLKDYPELSPAAGRDGKLAFQKMVSLLQEYAQTPDGILNLPADGNSFPSMPGARQGGLFAKSPLPAASLTTDAQAAFGLEVQIEQQLAALKGALQQIQQDASATPGSLIARHVGLIEKLEGTIAAFGYRPPLPASVVANLDRRVAAYRAPQYDQALQQEFWPHVYNELPGTGPNTDRLQVITGTNQAPVAVQISGTITQAQPQKDGDLHLSFQPDDPAFPINQSTGEPPLELEIIYAGPVSQPDAVQAGKNYSNPFDVKALKPGIRIHAAGPLIFDRAHGQVDASGNVQYGLEIHPLAGMTVLSGPAPVPSPPGPPTPVPPASVGQLSADLATALGQAGTLGLTLANLTSLIQKMEGEAPAK
jgi:hypothetical protein